MTVCSAKEIQISQLSFREAEAQRESTLLKLLWEDCSMNVTGLQMCDEKPTNLDHLIIKSRD